MKRIYFFSAAIALGVLMFANHSFAATINAVSCSQTDVQSAINSASVGDIVAVPAGTCTWTTVTSYTPTLSITKKITLQGAGIDQTIINDGTGTNAFEDPLHINGPARITGFTFADSRTVVDYNSFITTSGSGWRIDHCKFTPTGSHITSGIIANGEPTALIDHNTFINGNAGVQVIGDGDTSWTTPSAVGTGNQVYIEDNTFNYTYVWDGAYDTYNGARYVFRYNTVIGTNIGNHGLDSGGFRSGFSYEIYNNTFTNPNDHIYTAIESRGGTGVVFNNVVTSDGGSYDSFDILRNYRSDSGYDTSWGTCDGTNPIDGNTPGWQGWPCKDQIGRGTNQTSDPVYLWNNTFKGNSNPTIGVAAYEDSTRAQTYHILINRDFFNDTPKPGYTPFTYPYPLTADGFPNPNGVSDTAPPAAPTGVSVQ